MIDYISEIGISILGAITVYMFKTFNDLKTRMSVLENEISVLKDIKRDIKEIFTEITQVKICIERLSK